MSGTGMKIKYIFLIISQYHAGKDTEASDSAFGELSFLSLRAVPSYNK